MSIRLAALGIFGCVAMTGCKFGGPVPMTPLTLSYEVRENLVTFEDPRHDLIRVAEFVDNRPKRERKTNIPPFISIILAHMRVGRYITGDELWTSGGGSVASAMSQSMSQCMQATNFFKEVKLESDAQPQGGSGLILTGTIDKFYSEQKLTNFWVFFFYKKKLLETPISYCVLTYNLIDAETGQSIKTNTVEATVKKTKQPLIEAGVDAARSAQTLVANEVTTRVLLDF
jgi:hypothetical protein